MIVSAVTCFFGQQVECCAGLIVLNARHRNFTVGTYIFVYDGYVVVNNCADRCIFENAKGIGSPEKLRRIIINVDNIYYSSQ